MINLETKTSAESASFAPSFAISSQDSKTLARCGELNLKNGKVQTPVFMPVGTHGTVRGIPAHDLEATGSEIMLCNTYHLRVRPGAIRRQMQLASRDRLPPKSLHLSTSLLSLSNPKWTHAHF